MRLRIQQVSDLSEIERQQMNKFVWSLEEPASQSVDDGWFVTLENNAVVIGFLVPKADEVAAASEGETSAGCTDDCSCHAEYGQHSPAAKVSVGCGCDAIDRVDA